uniref:Uncharacterized protein n=1 Tax=Anopheles farauti TaxID=69004 RepID=A0A182QNQ4_9DIPT
MVWTNATNRTIYYRACSEIKSKVSHGCSLALALTGHTNGRCNCTLEGTLVGVRLAVGTADRQIVGRAGRARVLAGGGRHQRAQQEAQQKQQLHGDGCDRGEHDLEHVRAHGHARFDDKFDKPNLRLGDERVVPVAQRAERQTELPLEVALPEELLQQQHRPLVMDVPALGRVRDITTVQHERQRLRLVHLRFGQRQQVAHVLQLLKVEGHVGREHHVDDERAQLAVLVARQVLQHVAVVLLEHAERRTDVVVLEHGPVVVEHRGVRAGHHVEVVGRPRVLVVVDERCQQRGEDLQIGQPMHQAGLAEHVVYGLCDIRGVQIVVVGIPEPAVALLDARQERLERGRRYLELVDHAVPVQQIVPEILDRLAVACLRQRKHIERPVVEGLAKEEREREREWGRRDRE